MSTPITKEQINAALQTVQALGAAIKELGTVPSGRLYAQVMNHISLESYNGAIGVLKKAGVVTETGHELKWVGPTEGEVKK